MIYCEGRSVPPLTALYDNPASPEPPMSQDNLAERFWAKVNKGGPTMPGMETCCWVWTGCRTQRGYGRVGVGGKVLGAHRIAWALANGPIPDGMFVCHRCDHPPCVRHLFLGTQAENNADMMAKGRQVAPPGERNGRAKLSMSDVVALRERFDAGGITHAALALAVGANRSTVRDVVDRRTWRHI